MNGPTGGQQPQGQAYAPNGQQGVIQMPPRQPMLSLLPGVVIAGGQDNQSPILTLISAEKQGKSATTITSLIDWPTPGLHPLVLAWDDHGPDACAKLGYRPHVIRIRQQAGGPNIDRARGVMRMLMSNIDQVRRMYGSVVIDCASTCSSYLHEDAKETPKNKNNPRPEAPYWELGLYFKEFINKVVDLGLPSVWLAWLAEGNKNETKDEVTGQKTRHIDLGGPDLMGKKLRNFLAGKSHHNFILEKIKMGAGAKDQWGRPCDDEGCVRIFHSKPWNNVNAGGRYSHLLPDPCPAHFGWVLSQITGRGPFAPPPVQR